MKRILNVFSAVSLSLSLALYPCAALAQGASDPKTVLDELYGVVGETCAEGAETGTYDPLALAKVYFATPLKTKLEGAVSSGSIDFDIFTDSQDCGLTDIDITLTGGDAFEATGVAQFKNYGEDRAILFHMARSNASWLITDVSYGHRAFSLDKDY